jgi:hypothetical protein
MAQGWIERCHRSIGNVEGLENHYNRGVLERTVACLVEYYDPERRHETVRDVEHGDMYHGRQCAIRGRREKNKRLTLERKKKENLHNTAWAKIGKGTASTKTIKLSEKF